MLQVQQHVHPQHTLPQQQLHQQQQQPWRRGTPYRPQRNEIRCTRQQTIQQSAGTWKLPTTRRWPPCLHRILWQRTCGRKAPTSGQDFVLLQPKLSMQLCEAHWNPLTGIVRKVSQAAVSDSPDRSSPRYACMLEAKCACHLHPHETHWNPHPRGLFWSSSTRCKTPYAVLLLFARDVCNGSSTSSAVTANPPASPAGFLEGESQDSATEARSISADHEVSGRRKLKISNPEHSLRFLLIIAGVETNSGPRPRCDHCEKSIRLHNPYLTCRVRGCAKVCHTIEGCSGFKQHDASKYTSWKCYTHAHSRRRQATTPPKTQSGPCGKCNRPFKEIL